MAFYSSDGDDGEDPAAGLANVHGTFTGDQDAIAEA
jgi:hypothetical protein